MTRILLCETCGDTGLTELAELSDDGRKLWFVYRCQCPAGIRFAEFAHPDRSDKPAFPILPHIVDLRS